MSGAAAGSGPWAVVHVPHSSAAVPEDVRATFALSDEMLQQELLRLTDRYTDEIFALDPAVAISVVFEVSRVVVDPERFLDDAIEPMASRGMGAVYTATTDGARLRVGLRETERDELLARFYEPHHEMLEAATENVLSATGRCLVIDGHSFPSEPLPSDLNQERPRPQVCIGTDPFHTPSKLASEAVERFRARGLTVAIDRPYAGALVPARCYRRDKRVTALMVEVNRHLYMDEASGHKTRDFPATSAAVQAVLESLMADRASLW